MLKLSLNYKIDNLKHNTKEQSFLLTNDALRKCLDVHVLIADNVKTIFI